MFFFITDDAKDDWWSSIDSGGDKIIGPHEALRSEIYKHKNVELFHMYSTSDFLGNGSKILKIKINQSSIDDATIKHPVSINAPSIADLPYPLRGELAKALGFAEPFSETAQAALNRARAEYSRSLNERAHGRNSESVLDTSRFSDDLPWNRPAGENLEYPNGPLPGSPDSARPTTSAIDAALAAGRELKRSYLAGFQHSADIAARAARSVNVATLNDGIRYVNELNAEHARVLARLQEIEAAKRHLIEAPAPLASSPGEDPTDD
ncbi:hypothetical protein [Pseudomonas sp. NPDC090201]|uniref:hypothetical protein n=1 Tax=Pseudomonas sp. NPDC090201 TaxID=3364475 RepID=UPI00382F7797